jgi:glycosyltransferase involved in cell wall biosynthesis
MKLSVIVPVYNVEESLRQCVESILSQQVDGMEIILVDDGSTDRSHTIAEELKAQHNCIKLISQSNKGLSQARNAGLEESQGDYITFVDSDDRLKPNTYKPLLEILDSNTDCDILEFSIEMHCPRGRILNLILPDRTYSSPREYWIEGKAYSHTYSWNKIFRRTQFFSLNHADVRFPIGKVFEDIAILTQLLLYNPKITTTSLCGYIYEWNPQGISSKAQGPELQMLLSTHIAASKQMNMQFMSEDRHAGSWVAKEETPLYLTIMNIQLSVCKFTRTSPILPCRKVNTKGLHLSFIMRVKVIILNHLGIKALCRLFSL